MYWGSDALAFRPSRWIIADEKTGSEALMTAKQGTFMPWASGPGVCPGMKFAQVEFAAVLSVLLHGAKVKPVARNTLKDVLADSGIVEVTLSVNKPSDLWLRWESLGRA
jgi:cytochrome P450